MQLYLLLTENCNLSCSFCIRGKHNNNFLDINILKQVLQKNDFSKYALMITGGEPTLHKDINEIINLTINKFRFIGINTNGINNLWIDNLKYKDKIHIQISIDGTKQVHNQLRNNNKKDILEEIENTIRKIEKYNIAYNISTTVSNNNIDNIKELINYIGQFSGMKFWKVSPQLPFGCGDIESSIKTHTWNDLVDKILDTCDFKVHIKKLYDLNLMEKALVLQNEIKPILNCGSGTSKFYIYPDFSVYPCTCLKDFPIGNLKTNSLQEIANNDKCKIFKEYKIAENSPCKKCKFLKLCNSGCAGISYVYFKKLGMGDYRCPILQEKLQISQ